MNLFSNYRLIILQELATMHIAMFQKQINDADEYVVAARIDVLICPTIHSKFSESALLYF